MKLFLDVGAHIGESLRPALVPRYGFDRLYAFEPVASCRREIARLKDPRITLVPFGLWNETTEKPIYDPGSLGASIFKEKQGVETSEMISLRRASEWFAANVNDDDTVFFKLNCEGAECDIIDDLIDSGEIAKVDAMLVSFDVRKVPSQGHREAEVRERLRTIPSLAWTDMATLPIGPSYYARLQRWLDGAGADHGVRQTPRERLETTLSRALYVWVPKASQMTRAGAVGRRLLPRRLHARVRDLFYPESRRA